MKFLHTADWQIGMRAAKLGNAGERVREERLTSVKRIIEVDDRQMVVLDDMLTATDARRLARVMGVLEEAAQQLQILVLTCHPERYRALKNSQFFDLENLLHEAAC